MDFCSSQMVAIKGVSIRRPHHRYMRREAFVKTAIIPLEKD
jgi:hypothetical protein